MERCSASERKDVECDRKDGLGEIEKKELEVLFIVIFHVAALVK